MLFGSRPLSGPWSVLISEAGAWAAPADIPDHARRLDAPVPGTVAQALETAGRFDRTAPVRLDDRDFWYVTDIDSPRHGPSLLRLEGLATIADVFWNGEKILSSANMFRRHDLPVTVTGRDHLAIAFRALAPVLTQTGPRARWRPQMITPPGLRMVRTTLLGHMPGWCPEIDAIGPWRPVGLVDLPFQLDDLRLRAQLDEAGNGRVDMSFGFEGRAGSLALAVGGQTAPVLIREDGRLVASITIPQARTWWPNGHGEQALYDVDLVVDGEPMRLGRTGFRTVAVDRGHGEDFALVINGVKIFCRGAVWTTPDIVTLPGDRASYEPFLRRAAEANMNMIRIGGTMAYESPDFFALCDELGLMVWQDFMFANFDYPAADPAFADEVKAEARDLMSALQINPSLVVLCGGSEISQQAAMMGLPERFWTSPLIGEILPAVSREWRPDVPYVPNSPFGGPMPFTPNVGVTHYYGVGAYCRPLEDARRAEVRFAAESLAFAQVPEQPYLDANLPVPAVHDPRWKARVPRDRGASWDFEDIRDHYLGLLYDVDPARLRREDPGRYLDLSRAVTGEVSEAVFSEWRRAGSTTNGALVWTLQDLLPGAGWGILNPDATPKPIFHALRRAFRPVQVILSDEGTNGLDVHVINDSDRALELDLQLTALRDGRHKAVGGATRFSLGAREMVVYSATDLFGAFFDTTYAFRFGPPAHDVTWARLSLADQSSSLAEAFHFPRGRQAAFGPAILTAEMGRDDLGWHVTVSTDRLAQSVHIELDEGLLSDNWFHLAPGQERGIRITPPVGAAEDWQPTGSVASLSPSSIIRF